MTGAGARRARAALALLVLVAGAGCGTIRSSPTPDPSEAPWSRVRDAHTRGVKLYDGLTTRAFATATWEAPAVRAARVERTAQWQALTAAERAKLEASEAADGARFEDFTVALFTTDTADNDLDAPKSSWRMALVANGDEALPVQVSQLRPDALLRTLYPAIGDFDVVYRIRFPRLPGGPRAVTLRLAGPRGKMDFPFETSPVLEPAPVAPATPGEPGVPAPSQR